jgi:hypothetical protein
VSRDENQAAPDQLGYSGHDLDEVSIGVAEKGVAVVLADVVGRLDDGSAGGSELFVGFVDILGPYDQAHGRAAGRRVDSMHSLSCFDCAKPKPEPTQSKFDMRWGPFSRGPEGLLESKKVAIETKASFDVASVEMDERVL